jgi:hypothetical protein
MPNGILRLYNKLNNTVLVSLNILGTFNIEDNLNETPSNMKVKVITSNVYREEFQVNTVAYHEDTNSWWVIKSDESSYMTTGEYEHEIQLVEYLEFYSYRHLPNCAFAPNTYDLEDMLNRLFDIAKLSISVIYPDFLDKDKIMPFFSFENFTVANAIKNIGRAINAIPKMSVNLADSGFVPTLTFINRNGADNAIVNVLDTQFPIAYEKNMNSNDQFTTRSVSNITNAKSSVLVISPQKGGHKNIVENATIYNLDNADNSRVYLPSKIDKVEFVRIIPKIIVFRSDDDSVVGDTLFSGYYQDENEVKDAIIANVGDFVNFTLEELEALVIPTSQELFQININDTLGTTPSHLSVFKGLFTLKSKFDFDTSNAQAAPYDTIAKVKAKTIHWLPFTNEIVMAESFRDGLTADISPLKHFRTNLDLVIANKTVGGNVERIRILVPTKTTGFFNDKVPNDEVLIQVGYYPIADIKVSIDNDNDAQDEKFFNQSGKVIDAVSVSKLITSHTNDSVEGTKIRNARYDKILYVEHTGKITFGNTEPVSPGNGDYFYFIDINQLYQRISGSWDMVQFTSGTVTPDSEVSIGLRFVNTASQKLFISQSIFNGLLPLGQLVRDSNQLYVITQRSIDGMVKNGNEYYNVIYTLSRNRVARSENIVADSSVISYKTPDDNLVNRSQLYKDYIELSLQNINQEAPYLPMSKALVLSDTLAGTNFDFTVLAKNEYGTTPNVVRYVKNPTTFDLHKAKLVNVNWQSNNLLGYRLDSTGSTYVQTPIVYTDNLGKATNFELLFLDATNLRESKEHFNGEYTPDELIPFTDLTEVDEDFYDDSVLVEENFSIRIKEDGDGGVPYKKDPFEIPVFEYMIQGNDDYNPKGNIVISNDLFSTFSRNITYHYLINNGNRITAENAEKIFGTSGYSGENDRRLVINRTSANQMDLDLFTNFATSTRNSSAFTNIAFYAIDWDNIATNFEDSYKFLFAINDYVEDIVPGNDKSNIRVFINNWKI